MADQTKGFFFRFWILAATEVAEDIIASVDPDAATNFNAHVAWRHDMRKGRFLARTKPKI